jgi:hypothetical protein
LSDDQTRRRELSSIVHVLLFGIFHHLLLWMPVGIPVNYACNASGG